MVAHVRLQKYQLPPKITIEEYYKKEQPKVTSRSSFDSNHSETDFSETEEAYWSEETTLVEFLQDDKENHFMLAHEVFKEVLIRTNQLVDLPFLPQVELPFSNAFLLFQIGRYEVALAAFQNLLKKAFGPSRWFLEMFIWKIYQILKKTPPKSIDSIWASCRVYFQLHRQQIEEWVFVLGLEWVTDQMSRYRYSAAFQGLKLLIRWLPNCRSLRIISIHLQILSYAAQCLEKMFLTLQSLELHQFSISIYEIYQKETSEAFLLLPKEIPLILYFESGNCLYRNGFFKQALRYYKKCFSFIRTNSVEHHRLEICIQNIKCQNFETSSLSNIQEKTKLEFRVESFTSSFSSSVNHCLHICLTNQNNQVVLKKSFHFLLKALEKSMKNGNLIRIGRLYGNLALVSFSLGIPELAEMYQTAQYELCSESKDLEGLAIANLNLGFLKWYKAWQYFKLPFYELPPEQQTSTQVFWQWLKQGFYYFDYILTHYQHNLLLQARASHGLFLIALLSYLAIQEVRSAGLPWRPVELPKKNENENFGTLAKAIKSGDLLMSWKLWHRYKRQRDDYLSKVDHFCPECLKETNNCLHTYLDQLSNSFLI